MNLVKHISAILTCTVLGCIMLKMIEGIGHRLNPGLANLDKTSYQTIVDYAANLPPLSIGFILLAYFVGAAIASFLAGYMTDKWELPNVKRNAIISGLLILIYVGVNLSMISYASTMNFGAPIACVLGIGIGLFALNNIQTKTVQATY